MIAVFVMSYQNGVYRRIVESAVTTS